jgi:hypothetical protein
LKIIGAMMDEDTKMEEWMYEFAWKARDVTQDANDRLDSKAMNLINFAGGLALQSPFFESSSILKIKDSL